ncbi:MAG: hypothetical protein ABI634_18970 [Acidobacteriota bacterium]
MAKSGGRTWRHRSIRTALKRLGPGRAEAFLRAAFVGAADILAVKLINEHMDRGETLADALLEGDRFGFWLEAQELVPQRFEVKFGCLPGPMVGDGGEWVVEFDAAGKVIECKGGAMWMS